MRPVSSWFVPDLALVAAAVTLFYVLFLFQGYTKLFRDSDAGWHIRIGEAILVSGEFPRTDPYSFSRAGQPWFAWEWLSDVVTGMIDRALGLRGVALFYGVAIAAGVWLWFQLHWALDGNFLLACAMAPLLLSTCNIHWLARPHVESWVLLLGAMLFLERKRLAGESACPTGWLGALGVAGFTALWANIHASFFFAPLLALLYALRGRVSWWVVAVAAVAPLANPYGWGLYQHVYRYLTDADLLARIGEFQSFDFHTPGSGQIIATVILGIAGGTLALTAGRWEHFLLAMAISALALRSARALPLSALLLLPVANCAITKKLPFQRFQAYCGRLRAMDARLSGLALPPLLVLMAAGLLRATPAGFPPDQFPVAAYAHLPEGGRLFAPDKFGGYLIYRSAGRRKVFFDGRSDFYGAEFLKQYSRMVQVRPGWREIWEGWHFSHALLPNDYPLAPALEQIGWREIYRDGVVTLLAAPELAPAACVTTEHRQMRAAVYSPRRRGERRGSAEKTFEFLFVFSALSPRPPRLRGESVPGSQVGVLNGSTEKNPDFRRRMGVRHAAHLVSLCQNRGAAAGASCEGGGRHARFAAWHAASRERCPAGELSATRYPQGRDPPDQGRH